MSVDNMTLMRRWGVGFLRKACVMGRGGECASRCVETGHGCVVVDHGKILRALLMTVRCATIWTKVFGRVECCAVSRGVRQDVDSRAWNRH